MEIVLKILVFCSIASLWDGASKLRVVALRNKNQSIDLDEYSPLVIYFFDPWAIFDLALAGQKSIYRDFS